VAVPCVPFINELKLARRADSRDVLMVNRQRTGGKTECAGRTGEAAQDENCQQGRSGSGPHPHSKFIHGFVFSLNLTPKSSAQAFCRQSFVGSPMTTA
jgi:hypothetical protein